MCLIANSAPSMHTLTSNSVVQIMRNGEHTKNVVAGIKCLKLYNLELLHAVSEKRPHRAT